MAAYGTGNQPAAAVPTGGVAGHGSWNLPNFVGELFKLSPMETPLLSMLGGLTGGMAVAQPQFTWQDTLHRAPALTATDRKAIEGADASFAAQSRSERVNVVEIFQYGVELTYTKQASTGLLGTSSTTPDTGAESILGNQPVQNEMSWQLQIKIEQAALDVEVSFLTGTLAYPNDGTARQTQGIIGAISDVAKDTDAAADWSTAAPAVIEGKQLVNETAEAMYVNGAPMRNCVIMVGGASKRLISSDYQEGNGNISPRSYNVFGVNVTDIETDFGRFPVALNRHLPAETVLFLEMDIMAPCFLPIPGKGHFFLEPLAKSGSYDRQQLYGEIGIKYGPQGWHAKVENFDGVTASA
jgi:hypothetical protein